MCLEKNDKYQVKSYPLRKNVKFHFCFIYITL